MYQLQTWSQLHELQHTEDFLLYILALIKYLTWSHPAK
uniref:Uncharacterized protein n=1 Tax=Arundo donax TaxID=35708 RepID=A0A0A8ZSL4_ARUDO